MASRLKGWEKYYKNCSRSSKIRRFMKKLTRKRTSLTKYELERNILVEEYIKPLGVQDERVLEALTTVPRHYFVPVKYKKDAYLDITIPTRAGQVVSQPSLVGIMAQALHLTGIERVLEIGTGTGYLTAVLSLLAKEVFTIEILPTLAKKAQKTLEKLGYTNVHVSTGNGLPGLPSKAPFDCIIVDGAVPHVPKTWIAQLKESGRIVVPIGKDIWHQTLMAGAKQNGKLHLRKLRSVQITPILETRRLKLEDGITF